MLYRNYQETFISRYEVERNNEREHIYEPMFQGHQSMSFIFYSSYPQGFIFLDTKGLEMYRLGGVGKLSGTSKFQKIVRFRNWKRNTG